MALRVILTTGGTGGHIFPAMAVAEALRKRLPDVQILFVGGLYGPEAELAQKAGLDFYGLPVRGMLGRGLHMLPATVAMLKGIVQAWRLVRRQKPDVIMGFGGYAAFATVFAAWLCGRPTGIHEQNAIPGSANRLLGKMVRRICLSWPDINHSFPAQRSVLTGNPIRADIAALDPEMARDTGDPIKVGRKEGISHKRVSAGHESTLLIMGGSQGARAINSLAISILAALRDAHVSILHQTGARDFDRVREAYKSHGFNQDDVADMVVPFIDDMAAAYTRTDLALCRAGATTLAELAVTGTPSVLIPFPFAAHDHQTGNARAMEQAGGALLLPEKELEDHDVTAMITGLLAKPDVLWAMGTGARTLARPEAAASVAEEIIRLATYKMA